MSSPAWVPSVALIWWLNTVSTPSFPTGRALALRRVVDCGHYNSDDQCLGIYVGQPPRSFSYSRRVVSLLIFRVPVGLGPVLGFGVLFVALGPLLHASLSHILLFCLRLRSFVAVRLCLGCCASLPLFDFCSHLGSGHGCIVPSPP